MLLVCGWVWCFSEHIIAVRVALFLCALCGCGCLRAWLPLCSFIGFFPKCNALCGLNRSTHDEVEISQEEKHNAHVCISCSPRRFDFEMVPSSAYQTRPCTLAGDGISIAHMCFNMLSTKEELQSQVCCVQVS